MHRILTFCTNWSFHLFIKHLETLVKKALWEMKKNDVIEQVPS